MGKSQAEIEEEIKGEKETLIVLRKINSDQKKILTKIRRDRFIGAGLVALAFVVCIGTILWVQKINQDDLDSRLISACKQDNKKSERERQAIVAGILFLNDPAFTAQRTPEQQAGADAFIAGYHDNIYNTLTDRPCDLASVHAYFEEGD